MKIAIDLNDVLRDFTRQFAKYYQIGYDHSYDMDSLELTTNDPEILFPFKSKRAYENFTYMDYPYEIFGCAPATHKELPGLFNEWFHNIENIDTSENIEFIIVSPMEHGLSIPSTNFFLSKFGCKIREIYFPLDSQDIWNKCDVLITANPLLLDMKPQGKITIKIKQDYNLDYKGDIEYNSMKKFLEDEHNIEKILKKYGC